ncbi:DUF368 domain-containing protein [Spirochaeta africana]|uniref:Putative membrane protein n=1 Tax=Spirochaeta africana (strain ATCC 700263 / DSM 8902 / Z-7692) TaxID=889378 RepID=H9ULR7_SPIAZ|nr:DUF368 domain-containing protein [Spirochaeta africana]AFG38460.1 putative membrane protein [Spirochaeta africana DSM 8902]
MKTSQTRPSGSLSGLIQVLQGMAIGVANVIPGVSGGTIAVLVGVYDRLIEALADFFSRTPRWFASLFFLLRIAMGAVIGIVVFVRAVNYAFAHHELTATLFFVGLVLGSVPVLFSLSGSRRPGKAAAAAFVFTALVVIAMGIMQPEQSGRIITRLTPLDSLLLFITGLFSLATMIIPGVSAAFILLVMGYYDTLRLAVEQLNIPVLMVFFLGGVIGLLSVSKFIRFLLHRYHHVTYFAILGLVFGSVFTLWPRQGISFDAAGAAGLFSLLAGGAVAVVLGKRPGGPRDGLAASPEPEQPVRQENPAPGNDA